MKKAIFFDLDGTLWDALIPLTVSWNETMKKYNKKYYFSFEKMKTFMGLTPVETAPLAFEDLPIKEGLKLFNLCVDGEIKYLALHPGKMYPNEEEVLKELSKKYDLYIISNCEKGYIENYLNSLKMNQYFKGHLCVGDNGFAKWKNIDFLKKQEGIDIVIYVGDTLKDKTESEKAGVKFIHAAYGFGTIKDDKNYINSISELPNIIEKIFKE
ncbi:MAG: HAD hydrolase-like protein [Bacilli bacterium]